MKKVGLIFILLIFSVFILQAVEYRTIEMEANIPEDFGMIFPDAIWLDRFAFEITSKGGDRELLRVLPLSMGSIEEESGSFEFTLLYYGNQSVPYNVIISLGNTVLSGSVSNIPLYGEIRRSPETSFDIEVNDVGPGRALIHIPPAGARNGVPVADVILSWKGLRDADPGRYSAELEIGLIVL